MADILAAVLLSVLAGASTGIGGLYAIFVKKINANTLGLLLGFSGGVMLVISFIDLMPVALNVMRSLWSPPILLATFFAIGVFTLMLIDLKVPHLESAACDLPDGKSTGANPDIGLSVERHDKMYRLSILMVLGITIHNIPEGLVVGTSYAFQPQFGIYVALAILIHNIPEGVAVSTALLGGNHRTRGRILLITTLSGMAEPIGALLGSLLIAGLGPIGGVVVTGFSLAFAAGVMVYVTVDELIPTGRMNCTNKHQMGIGILLGIVFIMYLTAIVPPVTVI